MEFKEDGTWLAQGPQARSAGTYRWLTDGRLETQVLESSLAIQVGAVVVREVRIDQSRLNLISVQTRAEMDKFMPPFKPGERRPNEVVVTSVFSRLPAQ